MPTPSEESHDDDDDDSEDSDSEALMSEVCASLSNVEDKIDCLISAVKEVEEVQRERAAHWKKGHGRWRHHEEGFSMGPGIGLFFVIWAIGGMVFVSIIVCCAVRCHRRARRNGKCCQKNVVRSSPQSAIPTYLPVSTIPAEPSVNETSVFVYDMDQDKVFQQPNV